MDSRQPLDRAGRRAYSGPMATLHTEFTVHAPAARVWDALRDFGAVHDLAQGFLTACELEEGGAVRLVTFANGMQVRERLVGIDDERRRIAYSAFGGRATHHNASAQVVDLGDGTCRFVWTTDVLPDAVAPAIEGMMQAGARAMAARLQRLGT
jgi:carbon monoxide dehydrogenase subunit G